MRWEPSLPANRVFLGAAGRFGGRKAPYRRGNATKSSSCTQKDLKAEVHQRTIGRIGRLNEGRKRFLTWPWVVRALVERPAFVGCGYVSKQAGQPSVA